LSYLSPNLGYSQNDTQDEMFILVLNPSDTTQKDLNQTNYTSIAVANQTETDSELKRLRPAPFKSVQVTQSQGVDTNLLTFTHKFIFISSNFF
jgi:hypothetical protein